MQKVLYILFNNVDNIMGVRLPRVPNSARPVCPTVLASRVSGQHRSHVFWCWDPRGRGEVSEGLLLARCELRWPWCPRCSEVGWPCIWQGQGLKPWLGVFLVRKLRNRRGLLWVGGTICGLITAKQVQYACVDAFISFEVGRLLYSRRGWFVSGFVFVHYLIWFDNILVC